jgi:serine/threonine protein kinase
MGENDDGADAAHRAGPRVPSPGDVLGRYRVIRELGRGGMGAVFLAEDDALARRVALKVILSPRTGDAERLRFEREAKSAARLSHPGIATIYDVGEHEGRPYLAMEFVVGDTLAARIQKGPLPADELLALALQLSAALSTAHAAGVVHRDLKPGNIMWTIDGQVKLLDFGLARHDDRTPIDGIGRTPATPVTETGLLLGPPAYMSPEQARGERVGLSSADFSVATVLFEAASGR